jgi:asparagine synthase (glutamine-hydrolysing)
MYLLLKSTFPGYTLSAGNDAIQMAHGVECRLPYLDHRVIELSTRLPIDRSLRTGVEKHLLREVARPVVSDAIYRRPKDRILAPELAIIETELLDELLHDVLRGPLLSATPFFDRGRVLALLDSLPQRDAANRSALNASLMLILSTCLMQQRFGIGQAQTR